MGMVEVELVRVIIDERCDEQAIFLRDGNGREFPIVIGIFEATAIDRIVKERRAERPLTHDLIPAVLRALGARLLRIEIDDLKGEVFFAKLKIARPQGTSSIEVSVDCRPSDAVALAVREGAPMFVDEKIIARVGKPS